jgi:hypothetical protein
MQSKIALARQFFYGRACVDRHRNNEILYGFFCAGRHSAAKVLWTRFCAYRHGIAKFNGFILVPAVTAR